MPDSQGRFRPISVPQVWPGHRDYKPKGDHIGHDSSSFSPQVSRPKFRPHPHGFGAWEVVEDEPELYCGD